MKKLTTAVPPAKKLSRVLVADDSENTRYVLATWLRRAAYEVVEAATGAEAIDIALTGSIDIAVLDVNLPDISGYAVCERIKAQPNGAVPVLHVSATSLEASHRSEGLRRGADGYLMEPIEREELLATVEALLRGAAAERTAQRLARRLRQLNEATLAIYQSVRLSHLIEAIAREACSLFESNVYVATTVGDLHISAKRRVDGTAELYQNEQALVMNKAHFQEEEQYIRFDLEDASGHQGALMIEMPKLPDTADERDELRLVLSQFGRAANTALKNMHVHSIERRIALTLQRSLLPDAVPKIEGVEFAVHYQASAEHAEVGGDFYEIFTLNSDFIVLAVGDVVGHSLEAAAIMAQLRTGIRSYMLEGHGPTKTMDLLNHLVQRFHPGVTATACVAVYDRRSGVCELVNAGHPPPLVISKDMAAFLPTGGLLLGFPGERMESHTFSLKAGDALLLYTDGLLERRGESLDEGFARLATASLRASGTLEDLCNTLLRDAGPTTVDDDIALVAFRRNITEYTEDGDLSTR